MNTRNDVMNVNMVEHQRSIMAVMGIDIWMPNTDVDTRAYSNSLYRDQATPENNVFQSFKDSTGLQDQTKHQDQSPVYVEEIDALKPEKTIQPLAKTIQVKEAVQVTQLSTSLSAETPSALKLDAFELQALCLDNCVIVVDVMSMSAEQNQLWRNIQSAMHGQYFQLKWPFALINLQDGRGAKSYIQGFLDAICAEKTKICLGQLPHIHAHAMLELASLQDMLEQPALKAKLWQMMQN